MLDPVPALVAARYNPDLKAKYQQLVDAGKPAKIAITAVMRKLVILANVAMIPPEKVQALEQYVKHGGVFCLDPSKPPAEAVVWFFATEDRAIGMQSFVEQGPGKAEFVGR